MQKKEFKIILRNLLWYGILCNEKYFVKFGCKICYLLSCFLLFLLFFSFWIMETVANLKAGLLLTCLTLQNDYIKIIVIQKYA